ncbi:hypothetical protein [Verrucomicrobium sp. 3C]|uniref:hypothetical protein n=1 Tax=Verrucomicrobium sp. 3C TaxID=1134055 RepID=UPI00037B0BB5|nr:hypothetical protein [Verrucomicrobium sp. 3C]
MRRIVTPYCSRGNVGKSTEAALRGAWMDHLGIRWKGFDLSPDRRTLASASSVVEAVRIRLDEEPQGELLRVLARILRDQDADVFALDPMVNMAPLLDETLLSKAFLEEAAEAGMRITLLLFPMDDKEIMAEIDGAVQRLGEAVDYAVIRNRHSASKHQMLEGSELERDLERLRAPTILLGKLLTDTKNIMAAVAEEWRENGGNGVFGYADALSSSQMPRMHKYLLNDWMRKVWRQYQERSDVFLPEAVQSEQGEIARQEPAAKRRSFNLSSMR